MSSAAAPGSAVVAKLVGFGRVLRADGVEVGPGRLQDAVRGLDLVDLSSRTEVYHALRCTMVSRHDDIAPFDAAFRAYWERAAGSGVELALMVPAAPPLVVPAHHVGRGRGGLEETRTSRRRWPRCTRPQSFSGGGISPT